MPQIKSGMIVLWSGAIVAIPPGYRLCDGNNGTPDLRDRFVIGAGDSFAPDDSGGSANHTHDFTSDTHRHGHPLGSGLSFGSNLADFTTFNADTGTTDPGSTLPPFYALAYIMKT